MTNTNSMKSTEIAGYIVRLANGKILTVSGECLPESIIGPGMRCAKVYKTERAARRFNTHLLGITTHAVNACGIEISWLQAQLASGGLGA